MIIFFLQGATNASYVIEARFSPPKPSKQQSKNLRTTLNSKGRNIALEINKGTWNVIITSRSSSLLLVSCKLRQIFSQSIKGRFNTKRDTFTYLFHFYFSYGTTRNQLAFLNESFNSPIPCSLLNLISLSSNCFFHVLFGSMSIYNWPWIGGNHLKRRSLF